MNVAVWLEGLGLQRYARAFRDNEIDAEVLPRLTSQDLREIGVVAIGHRRKLLDAIAELDAAVPAATVTPAPPDALSPGDAERRQLTVMFCDLVDSTALSAGIDPEEMRDIIDRYYAAITGAIARFNGFIARYLGDGALVYFGWPRADESDAERAIRAGLELIEAVRRIEAGRHLLQVRIGIATGLVVIGNPVGSGPATEELAVGDTLNLAARLQTIAAPDGMVIADSTRRLVGRLFALEATGPLDLKGIPGPTIAWCVTGERAVDSRFAAVRSGARHGLVDREAELALLLERWAGAARGRGSTIVLTGDAGIGKSRVTQELLDCCSGQPHQGALFQCSPLHASTALYPAIRHLIQAFGLQVDDSPEKRLAKLRARIGALGIDPAATPVFAELLSLPYPADPVATGLSPPQRKARVLAAVTEHLVMTSREEPLLLLVEDAHWIDPTTLELLEALHQRIEHLAMLLVVTTRPDFVPFEANATTCTVQAMQRLDPADAGRLVEQVAGHKPLPPGLAEEVLGRTDGVPLFIEELLHSLLESDSLIEHADGWEAPGRLERIAIPTTLQDSLMARLDRLGPSKEVAQLGAVLGREFSVPLLAAVTEADAASIARHLDRLVEARLLVRAGGGTDNSYVFRHALIQDAAYESLLLSRRRQLHGRVATALEERFPEIAATQPELVARHHAAAGQHAAALTWWQRAADHSLHRSANIEAIEHCARSLELLTRLPEGTARDASELGIRIQLGVALSGTHGYTAPEWKANTTRLIVLTERAESPTASLIPVLWHQWVGVFSAAEMDEALMLARRMVGFAERSGERTLVMVGHRVLGMSLVGHGEVLLARRHLEQALALHDATRDAPLAYVYAVDQRLSAMGYLSLALIQCGYPDRGMLVSDDARADALRLNQANTTGFTLSLRLGAHMLRGDGEGLRATAEELLALAGRHRQRGREVLANTLLALLDARETRAETPLVAARGGIAELQALHWNFWVPWLLLTSAELRLARGDTADAGHLLADAEGLIEPTGYMLCAPEMLRLRGRLLNSTGQGAAAAQHQLGRAIDMARQQGARLAELRAATELAQLMHDTCAPERARSLLEPIAGWFTEGFDLRDMRDAQMTLAALR